MPQTTKNKLTPQEVAFAARKDPLSYGISYIDLLENKQWQHKERLWAPEIYKAVNPWEIERHPEGTPRKMVVQKSTQCGLSTAGMVKMFHFADNWPVRLMYTLPRQQDLYDLVATRVTPMIESSDRLRSLIREPDSVRSKRIGDSFLFFTELTVEPRMMPIDALYIDEVDLSDQSNMGTAINRLDASLWKLIYYFSTPTIGGYGINGLLNQSSKNEWFVKCPHCGYWQEMDWDKNLVVIGRADLPDRVYYSCVKCKKEITPQDIQGNGQWVPEHPEFENKFVGFHVHQLMTHSAADLYEVFRDPQTTLVEFYRKRLGKPYELGSGSISRSTIIENCFDEPVAMEYSPDARSQYYMGVDQGNELQVVIGKLLPGSTRIRIVHAEAIPFEDGFDRLEKLFNIFKIKKAVIDADPNRHSVRILAKRYPGRVIMADYSDIKDRMRKKFDEYNILYAVILDRTENMDRLMKTIREGEWLLPGNPSETLPPETERIIDHLTALKRDIETRRTPGGEMNVAVWRNSRPDHFAHSMLYLNSAVELQRGRNFRATVITTDIEEDNDTPIDTAESLDDIGPNIMERIRDQLAHIISRLYEVPADQLTEFIANLDNEDYEPQFPLSYKLTKVAEYDKLDVILAMKYIISDKTGTPIYKVGA